MKITFKQITEDPIFKSELEREIKALKTAHRLSPGKGLRYRRTPMDHFIDEKKDNVESFTEEYLLIINHKSTLSRAQRFFIIQVCNPIAKKVLDYYDKSEQEKFKTYKDKK